ncbi:glycosyltransferase family 4 protein [soil metagenome]
MKLKSRKRVLVVGPSSGKGGIASVLRMHRKMTVWKSMNCYLLATFDDRNLWMKLLVILKAYAIAPFLILRSSLVHIHLAAQTSMIRKLPFVVLCKILRKPLLVHLHAAGEVPLFQKTPQWIVRLTFLLSNRVVVLSSAWADMVLTHVPQTRIVIMHNPVATPFVLRKRSLDDPPVVLYVGKLEARKGYADLLAAAAEVLPSFPNLQIWLLGNGEVREAQERAKSLRIERSVRVMGWVDACELDEYYRRASIFCLPSFDEGLPMALLEAMSYSLPVICTPVGGVPDIISDGKNGLFAKAGDADSIRDSLLLLLGLPDLADRLGANAARTVEEQCGMDRIEVQLQDLYDTVESEWHIRRQGFRESTQATAE